MNNFQRQILADMIDEISRRIENYEKSIVELERKLMVKNTRLHDLREEKRKLEEGIDW